MNIKVQTHLKSGAQGCEALLKKADKIVKDMQDLRAQMGQMAKMMEQK